MIIYRSCTVTVVFTLRKQLYLIFFHAAVVIATSPHTVYLTYSYGRDTLTIIVIHSILVINC